MAILKGYKVQNFYHKQYNWRLHIFPSIGYLNLYYFASNHYPDYSDFCCCRKMTICNFWWPKVQNEKTLNYEKFLITFQRIYCRSIDSSINKIKSILINDCVIPQYCIFESKLKIQTISYPIVVIYENMIQLYESYYHKKSFNGDEYLHC